MTTQNLEKNIILIIDDIPDNIGVLATYLVDSGFDISVAEEGESCIIQAKLAKPDIILLDVMMDDLDGWEVARKLKAQESTKNIPIVMFTVMVEDQYRKKSFEYADADWHVSKPFESEVFFEILSLATEKKEELEQRIESAIDRDEIMVQLLEMINPKLLSQTYSYLKTDTTIG